MITDIYTQSVTSQDLCSVGIITKTAKRFHLKCQILPIGNGCLELWMHRKLLRLREKEYLDRFAMFSMGQKKKAGILID